MTQSQLSKNQWIPRNQRIPRKPWVDKAPHPDMMTLLPDSGKNKQYKTLKMKTVHTKGHIEDLHLNWKVERERIDNHMIWTLTVESWGLAEVRVKSYQLEPAEIDKVIVLMSAYQSPGYSKIYENFQLIRAGARDLIVVTDSPATNAVDCLKSLNISEFLAWCPFGLTPYALHDPRTMPGSGKIYRVFQGIL